MSGQKPPDAFTLYLLGTAVDQMRGELKKDIGAAIVRGDAAEKLLIRCLPFLRSVEAKGLRAEVLKLLESSKNAAGLEEKKS